MKIIIAGAGLGGLTAGLALRRAGNVVDIYEAAPQLGEVGAGLTLSRGAQAVFRALGIQDQVARFACRSASLPFMHCRSGAVLAGAYDNSDGLPDDGVADVARQIHRADLHSVLAQAFSECGPAVITGHQLIAAEQDCAQVAAQFGNGARVAADVLIGADGVRSAVREAVISSDLPRFTGQLAFRFLVPAARAAPFMGAGRSGVYIGPRRTFNRYTLRGGAVVNCVGIVASTDWIDEGWSIPASPDEMRKSFAGWHKDVLGLIGEAEAAIKWGLFDRTPLRSWTNGRITLLGDAAHAMLPFLGMGAAMSIEDGMILARAFSVEPDAAAALARYEAARLPRTGLIHAKSVEQGRRTQARYPDRYNGAAAPAADPAILGYNPVTAPI